MYVSENKTKQPFNSVFSLSTGGLGNKDSSAKVNARLTRDPFRCNEALTSHVRVCVCVCVVERHVQGVTRRHVAASLLPEISLAYSC